MSNKSLLFEEDINSMMDRTTYNQKSVVVNILSKAFNENKSVNYVIKPGTGRESRIRKLMEYSFEVCQAFGEVWISEDKDACALILHPDKKRTSIDSIFADLKLAISVIGLTRIATVLGRESRIKVFHPKEPFSYLWFIGVNPAEQNKGKGSLLLKEIIDQSIQNGRSIYLETSVDKNVPWYRKHGFQVFQTLDFTYTLYMMKRLP